VDIQSESTVFEKIFSAMGTIPFTNLTFNEVLPPLIFGMFFLTLTSSLFRKCCKCPRLDGESHKTDDVIGTALEIVASERRKYVARDRFMKSRNRRYG
jgi:hypothetical protein